MSNYTVSNSDGTADYSSSSAVESALSGSSSSHQAWFLCGDIFNERLQATWNGVNGTNAAAKAYYLDGGTPTAGVSGEKPHFKSSFHGDWAAGTDVNSGDIIGPSEGSKTGYWYTANNSGTTGGSEPSWPSTEGNTVGDNGITWTCASVPATGGYSGIFEVTSSGGDYFDFENLKGSNHAARGLLLDASGSKNEVNATGLDFQNLGDHALKQKMRVGSATFDGWTATGVGKSSKDSLGGPRQRPGWITLGNDSSDSNISDVVEMKNCVFQRSWQEGAMKGKDTKSFHDNLMYACWVGPYITECQNATAYNFIVLGTNESYYHRYTNYTGRGLNIAVEVIDAYDNDTNDIYNFLVAGTAGVGLGSNSYTTSSGEVYCFKNTHISYGDVIDNLTALVITSSSYTVDAGSSIKNMIFYDYVSGHTLVSRSGVSGITWDYNHWPTDQTGEDWASANDTSGDPEFSTKTGYDTDSLTYSTDIDATDIVLQTASECEGTGVAIAGITTDYNGTTLNSPPDKGAVAYPGAGADTTPPSQPGTPTASNVTTTSMDLDFTASTDETAMHPTEPYKLYSDNWWYANLTTNSYSATGLTPNTEYTWAVKAQDAAGNLSTISGNLVQSTSSPGDTTPPSFAGVTSGSVDENGKVTLNWTQGTDSITVQGSLIYRVFGGTSTGAYDTTNHIESVTGAGSIEFDAYGPGMNYYTVQCEDQAGNRDTNTAEVSVDAPKLTAAPARVRIRARTS